MKHLRVQSLVNDAEWNLKIPKKHLEDKVKFQMCRDISHHLFEEVIDGALVTRKPTDPLYPFNHVPGQTQYEVELFLATREESLEYERLKLFRDRFKDLYKQYFI